MDTSGQSRKPEPTRRFALTVSLIYAGLALLWIFASDRALELLLPDLADLSTFQTVKGSAFVVLTALLIYVVLLRRTVASPDVVADPPAYGGRFMWLVTLVIGTLVLVMLAEVAYNLANQRRQIIATTQRSAQNLARVIEAQTANAINAVDITLSSVGRAMPLLPGREKPRDAEIHALLRADLRNLPFVRAIWVLDANGNMIHDSDNLPGNYNLADRDYFKVHRADPLHGLHVDPPILSRLGVWLIGVSRRIDRVDGSFGGIVAAAIEPRYFEQLFSSLDTGTTGILALVQPDGVLIARAPPAPDALGKPLSPAPPFVALLANAAFGTYRATNRLDSIDRIYAYRKVPERPLVVVIGLGETERLAGWRRAAFANTLAALLFGGLLAALTYAVMRQIGRRDALDQRQLDSARRLQMTAAAGNIGLWSRDLARNTVHFSPEWKRQLGYADDEITDDYLEWQSRLHPEDIDRVLAAERAYMEKPWPNYSIEFRLRHKDGSYRWLFSQASLIRDAQGTPTRMLGSHVDITERKQAEAALRASETRYRSIFETTVVGITEVGMDGRWLRCNKAFHDMTGYSAEELTTRTFGDITHPEDLGGNLRCFNAYAKARLRPTTWKSAMCKKTAANCGWTSRSPWRAMPPARPHTWSM